MARRCSECSYCRLKVQLVNTKPPVQRRCYFCCNPGVADLPASVFRDKRTGFIGHGSNAIDGKLTIKTHPRWCPVEIFGEN